MQHHDRLSRSPWIESVRGFMLARLDRTRATGLRLTIATVAFIVLTALFGDLLEEILDNGALVHWDTTVSLWFHVNSTPTGRSIFYVFTQLGSPIVWGLVALVAIWLWVRRERGLFGLWLAGNIGGNIVQNTIKMIVHRSRPEYAATYIQGHTYSFPSGHTMSSTICYLLLAFTITSTKHWYGTRRLVVYLSAAMLVIAIAFSRVYLGVHYPSDVVGGLLAGLSWILACFIALNIRVRKTPEA